MTDSTGRTTSAPVLYYISTTYPRLSETFLQREVEVLKNFFDLRVISLWGGKSQKSDPPVLRFHFWEIGKLLFWIPYWLLRRPSGLYRMFAAHCGHPPSSWLNWQETLLGMAAGIVRARRLRDVDDGWMHAVWATMPATFAWTVHCLTGRPYSFGAHAYDLFQSGGDSLLPAKLGTCAFVHTTTKAGAEELTRRGCPPEKLVLIRRGLTRMPPLRKPGPGPSDRSIRCLSVGRLVEKKGWFDQLLIYREMADRKIPFQAKIIGDGCLRDGLENEIGRLQLREHVQLLGRKEPTEVEAFLQQADFFLFTGKIASDGDRDGLPNVIPEALANGVIVIARTAPGVCEAIKDGVTGLLMADADPATWADAIERMWQEGDLRTSLAQAGRQWVEDHFLACDNASLLAQRIYNEMEMESVSFFNTESRRGYTSAKEGNEQRNAR